MTSAEVKATTFGNTIFQQSFNSCLCLTDKYRNYVAQIRKSPFFTYFTHILTHNSFWEPTRSRLSCLKWLVMAAAALICTITNALLGILILLLTRSGVYGLSAKRPPNGGS